MGTLPSLRLFRVKELKRDEQAHNRTLVEKNEPQEDCLQGLSKLFEGLEYECSRPKMLSSDRTGDSRDIVRSIKETQQPKKLVYIKGKFEGIYTHLRNRLSVDGLPEWM